MYHFSYLPFHILINTNINLTWARIGVERRKTSRVFLPISHPLSPKQIQLHHQKRESLLPKSFKGFLQGWGSCSEHNHSSSFTTKENWYEGSDHSLLSKRITLCRKNHYIDHSANGSTEAEQKILFLQSCHTRHWPILLVEWIIHRTVFLYRSLGSAHICIFAHVKH